MHQISLMSGPERRRQWNEDQKRALVAAAFAPGASVAEVARRADIGTGLIYRWRQAFQGERRVDGFVPAMLTAERPASPKKIDADGLGSIVVEFSTGARVRIGADAPLALVTATLKALQS